MKEHDLPYESFIAGWYIPEEICNDLLSYFDANKDNANEGTIGYTETKIVVDKEIKESLDLSISAHDTDPALAGYRFFLQKVLDAYVKKYPDANNVDKFNVIRNYNIQYYCPGGGFKTWHSERSSLLSSDRHLVFMTFLNTIENGGTEFKYQNLIVPAIKGLTIIWPTDWTHTHKGVVNNQNEKYIITGWFSYS